MANPVFLKNSANQNVTSIIKPDGTVLYQLAVGDKALSGYTGHGGWMGAATHGSGATFAAGDGVDVAAGLDETDGTTVRPILVDATGRAIVEARTRRSRIVQTPTVSSGAVYAAKDAIGGLLTFAASGRANILTGLVESVTVVDKGQQMAQMDLVLFAATFTAPTDNAVFAPSDAELATCIGVIPIVTGDWKDFSTNSIAIVKASLPYVLSGTSMYGALVSRGTPTYTSTSDIIVSLIVRPD